MVVDTRIVALAKRILITRTNIEAAQKIAWDSFFARNTEVTITSANFEGGSSNGQIVGDPLVVATALEFCLKELDAEDANEVLAVGAPHTDFSTRMVRT